MVIVLRMVRVALVYSLWCAATIMATPPTATHYQHLNNEWQTLDYDAMQKIVQAIADAIAAIISEP